MNAYNDCDLILSAVLITKGRRVNVERYSWMDQL